MSLIRSPTLRLPGPGELDDGVPAPGLDPVLGGGLQHPGAGVGPGVGVVVPGPHLPLSLAHSAPELAAGEVTAPVSLMITLLTTGPVCPGLVSLTLSISPRPVSVSPPVSVSVVATVPPAALGLDLLEEEAETAEEETQPHGVWISQSEWSEH